MKITAKGNSAWLVLTERDGRPTFIRTREVLAVSELDGGSLVYFDKHVIAVEENHIDILRALEVNLPTPGSELQTDDITQGS